MKYTELMKFITAAKTAINEAYTEIETALTKETEKKEQLKQMFDADAKNILPKYSREYVRQAYADVFQAYEEETAAAVNACQAKIKEQKAAFMDVVNTYYRPDGKQIDSDCVALLNSGIKLSNTEMFDMVMKYSDNMTMLRIIEKYVRDMKVDVPQEMRNIFWRVSCNGSMEEKAFDRFVNLAGAGLSHPDRYFYLYQARLDAYEDNARLELMKSTVVRNEELLTEIKKTEMELIHLNIATLRVEQ